MKITFVVTTLVCALVLGSGCATGPKKMTATGAPPPPPVLKEMDIVEQPELEPDWADWVKEYYPNWRKHYWVDRGQWGNRGYIMGHAPSSTNAVPAEASMTPLPPAPEAPPAIVEEAPPVIEHPDRPTTYTVKKGDSLWRIAGKIYHNPLKWPRIYHANKDKIKNPHRIYPGQVLTIPWD
jgi:hypothetical protein